MKIRFAFLSCLVFSLAALLAAPVQAQANCTSLSGTIVGQLNLAGADGPGWYGWAYLTFGKDPTVYAAKLVDLNDGYKNHPFRVLDNGSMAFAGNEILTFTVDGVGSFQMHGHFTCIAGSTPNFCGFSEEGKLAPEAGTGDYAGMKGNISSHGMAAGGTAADQPWYWLSQMTGSVCKP